MDEGQKQQQPVSVVVLRVDDERPSGQANLNPWVSRAAQLLQSELI